MLKILHSFTGFFSFIRELVPLVNYSDEKRILAQTFLIIPSFSWAVSNSIFLQSLQVSRHERRLSQIDAINEMPLYPTEQVTENFQYFFFYHVWNGKIAQVWITTWRIRFHMCLYLVIKNKTSITKENVSTQCNHFNFFVNICFPDFVGWKYCSNRILFIRRYFEGICQYFFIVVFVLILNVSYFIFFFLLFFQQTR